MKRIPFVKYTSCGNNFVIVDETKGPLFSESELSRFAFQATNTSFGVGCDNLLVIQRCTNGALAKIARERAYWQTLPDASQAQFIFRMFEPSGEEALCCGNGLMSIASYLATHYGIENTRIMTEIPFASPRTITIGCGTGGYGGWADMGHPRRTPEAVVAPGFTTHYDDVIDEVKGITIKFRFHDLKPYTDKDSITLSGYLVFTGEPHLVVFPDQHFSIPSLADYIFGREADNRIDMRTNFGSWLIHRIGSYVNTHCQQMFPAGVNINFARINESGAIENRCFERGINRETLACGTGALAVAYVARRLDHIQTKSIDVLPLRCRWYDPAAFIRVRPSIQGWQLSTDPVMLFDGMYRLAVDDLAAPTDEIADESVNICALRSAEVPQDSNRLLTSRHTG